MELLEQMELPNRGRNLVQAGKSAADNLIKLLTDVLDATRLEADALELFAGRVELPRLLDEWSQQMQGGIVKCGRPLRVQVCLAPNAPDAIYVDELRLSQVISNLIDNAIRFTDEGEIKLSASRGADHGEGSGLLKISVSDTGLGIAEEHQEAIFHRFRQVDGSITRGRGGSGLGLSICRDIIELLGGEICVESVPSCGSVFTVTIPIREKELTACDQR